MGANTLLSRIFGFARDLVLARMFGADAATDAFFVAFKIPNFLRRLFAEGAFSVAFVPVLTEYHTQRSQQELKTFVDRMAGTLGLVLTITATIGVLAAPLLIMISAPGFLGDEVKYDLAVEMLHLTFPYLFFISMTAFAGSIMNTHQRFGVPAFTPILLNLSLIGCAFWLSPLLEQPVLALAWGVLLGGFVQFMFQAPFLYRLGMFPRPRVNFRDAGVVRVMRLMVPALFGVSVSQINLLLDVLLASFLVSGSISWLYYSDRLVVFPVGLLGVALGTVILPNLSRQHVQQDPSRFSSTLDWAIRLMALLGLPAAVGLLMLSGELLTTLFYSSAFTVDDVQMAQRSLMAYAPGMIGIILIKVLAPGYYARQDTRTPVKIGVIAMVANMALNIALIFPLAHAGLALATALSSMLNAYLLWHGLLKDGIYRPGAGWWPLSIRIFLATLGMGLMLWWFSGDLSLWFEMGAWERVVRLLSLVFGGILSYFALLFVLGWRYRHVRAVN